MNINVVQIIFQIVNFAILLFLLKKYLYGPILRILEQRARKIRDGLEAAERSILEQEKLEHEKKKLVIAAQKDAHKILEGARLRAEKVEKDLIEKAHQAAETRIQKAENIAKARIHQMEHELERKFTETVVETTETLLKDTLTARDQKAIIHAQIERLKKMKKT